MIQTCLSILTRALAGVGVYKIQKCKDKKSQTTQNSLPLYRMNNLFQNRILPKMLRILLSTM